MNTIEYINWHTQSTYGFGCSQASGPHVSPDPSLIVLHTVRQNLPEGTNYLGIASILLQIMEQYQEQHPNIRIGGRFFEAKHIQVIGDLNGARIHDIRILGQEIVSGEFEEEEESQIDNLTNLCHAMSTSTHDEGMIVDC